MGQGETLGTDDQHEVGTDSLVESSSSPSRVPRTGLFRESSVDVTCGEEGRNPDGRQRLHTLR